MGYLDLKESITPFTYLGVPIVTSKLSCNDYKPLVDKILVRINSWKSKFLSYVGRLILLYGVKIYWASIFLLPSKVLKEIEAKLTVFFWVDVDLNKRKARVAWEDVCLTKEEGGLRLIYNKDWNKATTFL